MWDTNLASIIFRIMIMEKFISMKLSCNFDLHHYPFDYQKCSIILANKDMRNGSIRLIEDFIRYSGPPSVSMYTIKNCAFKSVQDNAKVVVEVELEREMMNIFLATILPSILIVIVSF